jgi:hypothetical protein
LSTLQAALRVIVLEDPSVIEHLPRAAAARLDRLLEASRLQASAYHALRREGRESALSPARLASWKSTYLLALARGAAFDAARREILGLCGELRVPVRLLREAHMAFHVHPLPELRPITALEIQVPPERAKAVRAALKSRRFVAAEPLAPAGRPTAPAALLERDGVLVEVRGGPSLERSASWDGFGAGLAAAPLAAEPAIILHADAMAQRSFCHSLALLDDLRVLLAKEEVSWTRLVALAAQSDTLAAVYLALSLLRDLFGTDVAAFTREAESALGLRSPSAARLRALCLSAILQHPAAPRLASFIASSLERSRVEPAPSA